MADDKKALQERRREMLFALIGSEGQVWADVVHCLLNAISKRARIPRDTIEPDWKLEDVHGDLGLWMRILDEFERCLRTRNPNYSYFDMRGDYVRATQTMTFDEVAQHLLEKVIEQYTLQS